MVDCKAKGKRPFILVNYFKLTKYGDLVKAIKSKEREEQDLLEKVQSVSFEENEVN
jgi:hypothetical protein